MKCVPSERASVFCVVREFMTRFNRLITTVRTLFASEIITFLYGDVC